MLQKQQPQGAREAVEMELYQVRARDLDAWIADNLQPSEEFQQQVKDTVRRICDFLKEQCFEDIKVDKTVKVRSLDPHLPRSPLSGQ